MLIHFCHRVPERDVCAEFLNWAHIGSGKWRCPFRGQFWTDLKISATWFTRDRKSVPTHPFAATTSSFKWHFMDLTTCSLMIKLDRKALRSLQLGVAGGVEPRRGRRLLNMVVINCSSEATECCRVQLIRNRPVSREEPQCGTSEHIIKPPEGS